MRHSTQHPTDPLEALGKKRRLERAQKQTKVSTATWPVNHCNFLDRALPRAASQIALISAIKFAC